MKYRMIDEIDKPLSVLTYGSPWAAITDDRKKAFHIYDLAWGAGFRTFDTAHSYGSGEEVLGAWIETRGHRNEAVILDKGCNPGQNGSDDVFSAGTIRSQLEESLHRLRTDHVELYILHRDDPSLPVDGIVEELNRLRTEGKILRFGGSNWTLDRIIAANRYADEHGLTGFTAVSPAYSLAEFIHDPWGGSVALSGEAQQPYRDWLEENRLPVFNYSALGRSYLSGKFRTDGGKRIEDCIGGAPIAEYDAPVNRARLKRAEQLAEEKGYTVPQICLAWLLHQKMMLFPIITPTSESHMLENVAALDIKLSDSECSFLLNGPD